MNKFHYRTCFIFRNPQPKTIKIKEILRPFVDTVWYLIVIVLLMNVIILALTLKWDCQDSNFIRISNSFITTIGAICQQGKYISNNR